uniref:G3BP-like protein n=1 Tax=Cajanus cajan TaxID=3821 RepID=A0A151SSB9_CAJCA|nr:Putative G3BP-like protein [Cajanus cajan]
MQQIHSIVSLLNFTTIEIKTINSLESWDGGVFVMVSGFVKIKDISGRRKFVQTCFLAPQEKGYFVLNDMFHFIDDGVTYPNMVPVASETIDAQPHVSASLAEPPVVCAFDVLSKFNHITINLQLRVAKGQPVLSAAPQHVPQQAFKSAPPPSKLNHVTQPAVQQSSSASIYVPEPVAEGVEEGYGLEEEGEVTSVYVRNLPANVTEAEIDQEFKNFGRIKPDGIFIRVRKEIGVCYAFVEFEDIIGVQNALEVCIF